MARKWIPITLVLLAVVGAALDQALPSLSAAAEQDAATPAATPVIPEPSDCTVAPLSLPLFAGTPLPVEATPRASDSVPGLESEGQLADAETIRLITAIIRESIACENAGEPLRQYALLSERFLRELFGELSAEEQRRFFAATPGPLAESRRVGLLGISDARTRPDGRVTAVVSYVVYEGDHVVEEYEVRLIFVRVGDRWLIDGFVPEMPPSASGTATP
mgnify:CR=1 FL=1